MSELETVPKTETVPKDAAQVPVPDRTLRSTIAGLVAIIDHRLSPGDVAALRRRRPGDPPVPAFWRVANLALEEQIPVGGHGREQAEDRWQVILAGMAEMQGLHRQGAGAGMVLGRTIQESRFLKLLRAHDEALHDALRVTAHHLASSRTFVDWTGLAWLVLSDGREDEDNARRALARGFYAVYSDD